TKQQIEKSSGVCSSNKKQNPKAPTCGQLCNSRRSNKWFRLICAAARRRVAELWHC
ncbi:unnamed protein product, partial [Ceratitis capitata]